ncbi:MAG TPA: hypothetical protein VFU76_17530 [Terriglobales bacterium]|nr:hypothetical protein [Terriglobales bacterium]
MAKFLGILSLTLGLALLAGCSVHEQHDQKSGDKKVDIQTPFGSIKVNTDANAKDTGWPAYPGAQVKPSEGEGHDKSANVNISGPFGAGVKVAVVEYLSDDPPEKVLGFYRSYMKTFGGQQLECKNTAWNIHGRHGDDDELRCDDSSHGDSVELKAGTKERQHIVAVKPSGKGSDFALVFVQVNGKEGVL